MPDPEDKLFRFGLPVLLGAGVLISVIVFRKPQHCVYCYDNGNVWIEHSDGRNARCFNGLGGIQMRLAVPDGCLMPDLWRPSKEEVLKELAGMEAKEQVGYRPPPGYWPADYWTNVISAREYKLRHPQP